MAEIVFEVVAFGLQDVVVFVFHLEAGAAVGGDIRNVLGREIEIGGEGVSIGNPAFFVANG